MTDLSGVATCAKAIINKKFFLLKFDNCNDKITIKKMMGKLRRSLTTAYNDDCKPCVHGQNPMTCGFVGEKVINGTTFKTTIPI